MCNCGITHKIGWGMLMAISILAILLSITCIQGALYGVFDPVLYYANYNIGVMIQGLIMFALLLAAGILGICGLRKKNFKCLFVMFFFILVVEGMAMNVALNIQGVYMALTTDDEASVSGDRFLVAKDIQRVAHIASTKLCTAQCPCNWTNTAELSYTGNSAFITANTASGAIISTGKTKFQDCPSPAWYDQYKKPAAMMEALEKLFNCSGFGSSPILNVYYFSDINNLIPITGNLCYAHYDSLVYGSTYVVGGQFFSVSIGALFLWVWMAIIGMNRGLSRDGMSQDHSGVGMKGGFD